MGYILPPNSIDPDHLSKIVAVMRLLGPPTIKAVWSEIDRMWIAIEGAHRLAAAAALGLECNIDEIDIETPITDLDLDVDDYETVGEWVEAIRQSQNYDRHHRPLFSRISTKATRHRLRPFPLPPKPVACMAKCSSLVPSSWMTEWYSTGSSGGPLWPESTTG